MSDDRMLRKKSPIFYGWFVVAAGFAVTFVGFGCVYSFSAFIESLQRDFGAARGSVSLVFSLAGFLYFALGIVSGPLADRFGSRRLAVIGMILVGMGLALASVARSLTEVYAAYGLGVGLGVGCSYVPAMGAVQRWFAKRRGFAPPALPSSGIGAGTLVVPPLARLFDRDRGMARSLSHSRLSGGRARRRHGAPHRERSARPWARPRWRRAAAEAAHPRRVPAPRSRTRSHRGNSSASMPRVSPARSEFLFHSCISRRTRSITASRKARPCCW